MVCVVVVVVTGLDDLPVMMTFPRWYVGDNDYWLLWWLMIPLMTIDDAIRNDDDDHWWWPDVFDDDVMTDTDIDSIIDIRYYWWPICSVDQYNDAIDNSIDILLTDTTCDMMVSDSIITDDEYWWWWW